MKYTSCLGTKLTLFGTQQTKSIFTETTTHVSHLSITSTRKRLNIEAGLECVQFAGTSECPAKCFKSNNDGEVIFCQDSTEEDQSLLKMTILSPDISREIFCHLEPNDLAKAAQFAFCFYFFNLWLSVFCQK